MQHSAMNMLEFVDLLIKVSEKASNIARKCREDEQLFKLLIEEKSEEEANPRFLQDFKTLADVLIQETVRYDLSAKFPEFRDSIYGEEGNEFSNYLGEKIVLDVTNDSNETLKLLTKVLNGNGEAASSLVAEVYRDIKVADIKVISANSPKDVVLIDTESIGIWIDPIDSTAEYIKGIESLSESNYPLTGLKCATVLIGVYNKFTGDPIIGIINQPFYEQHLNSWRSRCIWGYAADNHESQISSLPSKNVICISSSENPTLKEDLKNAGFALLEAAGAGYKLMAVLLGDADAYVLTKDTTFKWDTCGPHAILRSVGGNLVKFSSILTGASEMIKYNVESEQGGKLQNCANVGGIIAYRDDVVLRKLIDVLGSC